MREHAQLMPTPTDRPLNPCMPAQADPERCRARRNAKLWLSKQVLTAQPAAEEREKKTQAYLPERCWATGMPGLVLSK